MKLKRLDIHGFKSFYHRTTVVFDDGITAIVGPNGCGKSNIVDALKWVMGEQGAKALRGSAMEDVIFNGSGQRGPMGMCEVGLTFRNDDGSPVPQRWAEVTDIAIQRRLERSKGSDYSVNRQRCRLADVQDLLSGTGIASGPGGRRAYAIIEQGQISRVVSAKADERRMLIEEAAGISRYRQRRHIAERKTLSTEQNLERVEDILAEIERQMRSLKRQAKKAERFREYRDEARQIALTIAVIEHADLVEERAKKTKRYDALLDDEKDAVIKVKTSEGGRLASQTREREAALKVDEYANRLRRIEETVLVTRERISSYAREKDMLHAQLDQAKKDLAAGEGRRSELEVEREETAARCAELEELNASLTKDVETRVAEHKAAVQKLFAARAALEGVQRREAQEIHILSRARADLDNSVRMQRDLAVRRERLIAQNKGHRERFDAHEAVCQECEGRLRDARQRQEIAENNLKESELAAEKARTDLDESVSRERVLRETIVTKTSRRDSLVQLEQRGDGLSDAARHVLRAQRPECLGTLSALWDVPAAYETALQSLLAAQLDGLVVESLKDRSTLVEFVRASNLGRIMLMNRAAALGQSPRLDVPDGIDVLGYLVDLIDPQVGSELLRRCTDDAVLVEDIETAWQLADAGYGGTVVTTAGDWIRGDAVTYIASQGEETGPLQRRREIKELGETLEGLVAEHTALNALIDGAREHLTISMEALKQARTEARNVAVEVGSLTKENEQLERQRTLLAQALQRFDAEMAEVDQQINAHQQRESDAKQRLEAAEAESVDRKRETQEAETKVAEAERVRDEALGQMHDVKARANTVSERLIGLKTLVSRLERQIKEIQVRRERVVSVGDDVERRLAELSQAMLDDKEQCALDEASAGKLAAELAALRANHEQIRVRVESMDAELESARAARDKIRGFLGDAKLEIESTRLRQENLALRLKERYQVDIETLVKTMGDVERPTPAQILRLEELEALLEKMGEVNVSAIEEYESVAERFEFLTTQREDLLNALADLASAIKEIDRTTRTLFAETFEAVRGYFRELFPRLFRGGEADLELTNPDDLLSTGINMNVSPPGKKIQSVELLSGGEKAMCAIALVFAVFKHRPSPFCLLDEVDAPLDDANIGRFNDVVREIAQRSQVILVTHNKRTMEIADALYGVTMEESGVSKLVSVRMT